MRGAAQGLRRLAVCTHERPPHPLLVAKPCLAGNDTDWMAALLEHQARRRQPQVLDCLGRRETGVGTKGAAELAGAEPGRLSQILDGQRFTEVEPGIGERCLDPVRLRLKIQ